MVQIAIIGGGIGGLTTALALQHFGFESQVFEQAPELHDVGAAIAIWPNAMRVLERLQLIDKILEKAGVIEKIRWLDQHGRLINHISISAISDGGKFPAVALHRADLQSTLLHALAPSPIHLGHQLIDQKQQGDKMIATFANDRSTEADFLIGADGIHSRVRAQFINDGEPIDRGYTLWRGVSTTVPSAIAPATAIELYGRGKRFGIGPVGLGRIGWWGSANGDVADDLSRVFAGWYAPVLELIESTPPSTIIKNGAFDRPSTKNWGRGRMTLLGDAIHPTTPNLGQGGCLAIEDAFVLARCFEKYGAVEEALRIYEHRRQKRTAAITKYSRYYGTIAQWENIWARALRRTCIALAPEALAVRVMQIVVDYDATTVLL